MKFRFNIYSIFIFFSLSLARISLAQHGCDIDSIMRYKGFWKKVSDDLMRPGPYQAKVINRIDKFQKILKDAYPDQRGTEAHWSRNMAGYAVLKNGPIPYELTVGLFVCYCSAETKKVEPFDETGTWVYIYFNQFNWFMDKMEDLIIENNPVYLLRKRAGDLNGFPLYEGVYNETTNLGTQYSRTVLISRSGQVPYIPVTKKEYLKAFVEHMEREKAKSLQELNHSWEYNSKEDKEKQKRIKEILPNTNFDSLEKVDKEEFSKSIKNSNQEFDELIKPAKELLLSMREEEGESPALLYNEYSGEFKGFATEGRGGRMAVRLNKDYINMGLMKDVPQFLVIYWSWDVLKPTSYWRDQLEKNLDFNTIRQLLDK